jgi:hypothetical protein
MVFNVSHLTLVSLLRRFTLLVIQDYVAITAQIDHLISKDKDSGSSAQGGGAVHMWGGSSAQGGGSRATGPPLSPPS